VWISEAARDLHGWKAGDRIRLPIAGRDTPVVVAGVIRDYARTWGAVLIPVEEYRKLTGDTRANDLAIHLRAGVDPAHGEAAVRAALPHASALAFENAAGLRRRSLAIFDRSFAVTYALEAVAVLVGLFGLASSVGAIVLARRREFGMLRHLGMTRAQIGANLGFSTKEVQTYTARLKAVYTPIKTLRNNFDYSASYGTTDGVLSENQMDGSWKLEYDVGKQKRFLVYNAVGAGYNEIQKIDSRYDFGPGMGYKLIVRTNYVLKTEFGGNFQQQYFSTGEAKSRYSLRLAEDMTWQIAKWLKFDNKLEFFPELDRLSKYRFRGEANLSYLLRHNLTLSLSVIDLYDTTPPAGVSNNDLQIRSLIGIKF
jgi:putative salt-induced outer membrane protein YdiY